MFKKNPVLIFSLLILTLACLTGYLVLTRDRENGKEHIDRVNRNLAQRVPKVKSPALGGLSNAPKKVIRPQKPALEPTLTREELERQRVAFNRTRFNPAMDAQPDRNTIVLAGRAIRVPENSPIPAFNASPQLPTARQTKPYIVHIGRPITPQIRRKLEEDGAILRGYLPNFAFLAELSADTLARLPANEDVGFVTEYAPDDKIDPFLFALLEIGRPADSLFVSIQTIDSKDVSVVGTTVEQLGGAVETVNRLPSFGLLKALVSLDNLKVLARMGEVQWMEEFVPVQKLNDSAALPEHINATSAWNEWYLTGKDQIVGHADTGLDTGDEATIKADFQGQIAAIYDLANGGDDPADYDGHGTHTAGSICGNGALSGGQYKGIAYDARLVSQCVQDEYGKFTGISDLYGMYMQSYLAGATIHSDSWGANYYGQYDSLARITDLFSWTYKDFLPVFAAGNSGRDQNNNGVVDEDSITSPGTSKNALSVGAAENDRNFALEGYRPYKYYNKWPLTFKTDPIKNDYISWSATTSPYMQGMAAFSSRGPTDDSRIKPDVSAPGTDVISTRSTVPGAGALWGVLPSNSAYCYSGGTSMATPLTAGGAALVRQYITERAGLASPSSALVKAAMIGGARSLAPGQYGTGAFQEIPFARPNNVEGWGQPDIEQSVHPAGMMIRLIDDISVQTGETNTFEVTVEKAGHPLEIVMCWTDFPGTAGAGITLINNLNLNVVDPSASLFYPNELGEDDDRNTVESLHFDSAAPGTYTVRVIRYNVPVNGGTAALYIRGAIEGTPILVHQPVPYYDATLAPYPVDFKVQSLNTLTNNELTLHYTTGTSMGTTGVWQRAGAEWTSNANYRAFIPQQPKDTTLYYYLALSNASYNVMLPADAAVTNSYFRMHLGTPTELAVFGSPAPYGTVFPEYGTNLFLSGEIFTASAYPETISATERLAAHDWNGTGDIPVSGSDNPFSQAIYQDSTLTWNWFTQYALTRSLYFRDVNFSYNEGVYWHWKEMVVPDQSTSDIFNILDVDYEELYVFYGWELDGARWPDSTSPSLNPLGGLVMSNAFTLQANYMKIGTDTDGDDLYDWWELKFYGSTSAVADTEEDGDNDTWTSLSESLDNTNPLDPQSYPAPPSITVIPLDPFQSQRPPWTVTAEISDNFIVVAAVLEWKEKDESVWRQVAMAYDGNGIYSAAIDPPSHGAVRVDYRVKAYDIIGYYDPSFMSTSPTYSVMGDYDTPWLSVAPETLGIHQLAVQPANYSLTVSNLAGTDLLWTGVVVSAAHEFAADDPGWEHSGTNDVWTVSSYRSWNGDPVWYCGNDTTHRYPDLCHASLDTPSFTVGDHGVLVFRHWMDFEKYGNDKPDYYWDGAIVMISTNNGASFTKIEPLEGYNAFIEPNPDSPFPNDMPCMGDTGSGWRTAIVDLSEYAGSSAFIRFEFGSDRYSVEEGWYVGGVTVLSSEAPLPPWLSQSGVRNGVLPDTWHAEIGIGIDPLLMQTNSEHVICVRVDSNDPNADPVVDLTVRRGFAVTAQISGFGSVTIPDSVIFRDETAIVDIQADYGSYITNITINGVFQSGDYGYKDTSRHYALQPVTSNLHFAVDFTLRSWDLFIESAHGSPSPAAGYYYLIHGSNISATASLPVGDANPMIRYTPAGYRLTGAAPAGSSPDSVSFSLTNHAVLTWLWTTNYQMNASSTGNGVVVPSTGWYAAGSSACITGYPSKYYHFSRWDGQTNGASAADEIICMPMDAPRTVSASFTPNLTPTHGVPEYWLASYGFFGNFENAAEGDQDSDRMETWKEYRADTDPTDGGSLLQGTHIAAEGGVVAIEWIGGIMRTQVLQGASEAAGPWTGLYTNLPPTAVTNALLMPYPATNRFFRIAVP